MNLSIAIRVGSPTSTLHLVKTTIESIEKNIGKCSYRFIISSDPQIDPKIKSYLRNRQRGNPDRFLLLPEENIYWSKFINQAILKSQDSEYFIKAHDDIKLLTPNFFPKVKKILSSIREPVGWVSFNEANYTYVDFYYGTPTRPGFHKDYLEQNSWDSRKLFQFHNLPNNWWKGMFIDLLPKFLGRTGRGTSQRIIKQLDMPRGTVKCHAPWNMFVMIKTETLKKIGLCENWKTYNALLVDEDWGLRALQKRFWNIWIPQISYLHLRPPGLIYGNRSQNMISNDSLRVHRLFKKKWGFDAPPSPKEIKIIKNLYKKTFIPWSIGRNSFDWDYITTSKDLQYSNS